MALSRSWLRRKKKKQSDTPTEPEEYPMPWGPEKAIRFDPNREQWSRERAVCMVCWIDYQQTMQHRNPGGIQIHEIVGGAMRSLESANYLSICSRCHDSFHSRGNGLTFEEILFCKWEASCLEAGVAMPFASIVIVNGVTIWNPWRLAYLRRRHHNSSALPSPMELRPRFIQVRSSWMPLMQDHFGLTADQRRSLVTPSGSLGTSSSPITLSTDSSGGFASCLHKAGRLVNWTP